MRRIWALFAGLGLAACARNAFGDCGCISRPALILADAGSTQVTLLPSNAGPGAYVIDFGQVRIAGQASAIVLLANVGNCPLQTFRTATSDTQFTIALAEGTVVQGSGDCTRDGPDDGGVTFPVTFTPSSSGPQSADVWMQTDSSLTPTITLTGTGI
jgi:hypothetical protein